MLKDSQLKKFFDSETICFSNQHLIRRTHGERFGGSIIYLCVVDNVIIVYKNEDTYEKMIKKYKYSTHFFDVTTGAIGKAWVLILRIVSNICNSIPKGECIYNHDKDFYFRILRVEFIKPESLTKELLNYSTTINI